jgi:hypothetical protein
MKLSLCSWKSKNITLSHCKKKSSAYNGLNIKIENKWKRSIGDIKIMFKTFMKTIPTENVTERKTEIEKEQV